MRERLPQLAVALVCAALGLQMALAAGPEARLDRAGSALYEHRHAAALAELSGLRGEASGRAERLRGYAYAGLGRMLEARAALRAAAQRSPNDWVLQRDYAAVLLRLGQRRRAAARMRRARALNPRLQLPPGFVAKRR